MNNEEFQAYCCFGIVIVIIAFIISVYNSIGGFISFIVMVFLLSLPALLEKRKQRVKKIEDIHNKIVKIQTTIFGKRITYEEARKNKNAYAKTLVEAMDLFDRRQYDEALKKAEHSERLYDSYMEEKQRKEWEALQEKEKKKREAFEKKQKTKGLVNYKDKWGTPEQVKKWREVEIGLADNFRGMSPYQFEDFTAKLFRKMGYQVEDIVATGDFGADLIARKGSDVVVIQCKKYEEGNLVTPGDVQRTLGAMHYRKYKANKAVIITTSNFTVRAKDLDKESPIELWDKHILHSMVRKYFIENEALKLDNAIEKKLENKARILKGLEIVDHEKQETIEAKETEQQIIIKEALDELLKKGAKDFSVVDFEAKKSGFLSAKTYILSYDQHVGGLKITFEQKDSLEDIRNLLLSLGFREIEFKQRSKFEKSLFPEKRVDQLDEKEFISGRRGGVDEEKSLVDGTPIEDDVIVAECGTNTRFVALLTDRIFRDIFKMDNNYQVEIELRLGGEEE